MELYALIILVITAIILYELAIIVFLMKKPVPDPCLGANPIMHRPDCTYLSEVYFDSSIPLPKQKLYLGSFTMSIGAGPPLCMPMWYAFRYVRLLDGGYGPMSNWTDLPINAGANFMPCYPPLNSSSTDYVKNCSLDSIITGYKTKFYNQPTVVTVDPLDLSIVDGYYLNVHRFIGPSPPSDPKIEGDIVGFLIAPSRNNPNAQGWTSYFTDAYYNPNEAC